MSVLLSLSPPLTRLCLAVLSNTLHLYLFSFHIFRDIFDIQMSSRG